jgi:hypothetical protein
LTTARADSSARCRPTHRPLSVDVDGYGFALQDGTLARALILREKENREGEAVE